MEPSSHLSTFSRPSTYTTIYTWRVPFSLIHSPPSLHIFPVLTLHPSPYSHLHNLTGTLQTNLFTAFVQLISDHFLGESNSD